MLAFPNVVKRFVADRYLAGTAAFTRGILDGRAGPRDFRRVVIVAPLGRNNGIASGARLQWQALRGAGVDVELLDAAPALRNPLLRIAHDPGSAYIFHAAGPQTANLIAAVLPAAACAWRVGYWAWELPDPPPDWAKCDRTLCEVWTPSAFARNGLAPVVDRPIHVVPHHVPAKAKRRHFDPGGPERPRSEQTPFTILAMADSRSSLSRKNPYGALAAFRAAFGTARTARLILKLNGRIDHDRGLKALVDAAAADGNVTLITDYLEADALDALFDQADVLLSLHRAEGFGLPMLEAMARGIPVVATGWSGNLEFMDESNSHLVPSRLVPVDDGGAIYAGSTWAEPDVAAAAAALRRLASDPLHYAAIADAAYRRASTLEARFPFPLPKSPL